MANRLDLPPELAALIEKREQEDRRKQDQGTKAAGEGSADSKERRSSEDRREN